MEDPPKIAEKSSERVLQRSQRVFQPFSPCGPAGDEIARGTKLTQRATRGRHFLTSPYTNNRHFSFPGGDSLREVWRLNERNVKDNAGFGSSGSTCWVYGMKYD